MPLPINSKPVNTKNPAWEHVSYVGFSQISIFYEKSRQAIYPAVLSKVTYDGIPTLFMQPMSACP